MGKLAGVQVGDEEVLARFITKPRKWVKDGRPTWQAFLPAPHVELSVTRHRDISDRVLWGLGRLVARELIALQIPNTVGLYGRADLKAIDARELGLTIGPDEPPMNHANISQFPASPDLQKNIAYKLADKASFTPVPEHLKLEKA